MPSHKDIPSIQQHITAYGAEINALRRPNADTRSGAGYDILGSTNAVLMTRQATRDRDLFRAIYYDASSGDDVDVLIERRFGEARISALRGFGSAVFERAAGGSANAILKGTRVSVQLPNVLPRLVEVAETTPYGTADRAATVPMRTLVPGASAQLSASNATALIGIVDPLDDASWVVTSVDVGPGLEREKDAEYKARNKTKRLAQRHGYVQSIVDACVAVGAEQIAHYSSDYLGEASDHGVNRFFVGFSSFTSTPELVRACRIAVDAVRVLGADLVVMGMSSRQLTIKATVHLWKEASSKNKVALAAAARSAIVEYFNDRQNAFAFRHSAMRGAVLRAMRTDAQTADIVVVDPDDPTLELAEPSLAAVTFSRSIVRYFADLSTVVVAIEGPVV